MQHEALNDDFVPLTNAQAIGELRRQSENIDHIAIAVKDLEQARFFYEQVLGFEFVEERRTEGKRTGMISVVLRAGPVSIALLQGTSKDSQVTRFIENFAPGVHHVAVRVRDLARTVSDLEARGVEFATEVIRSSDMQQRFTKRDANSGVMIELIQRGEFEGFSDESVTQLFKHLEESEHF